MPSNCVPFVWLLWKVQSTTNVQAHLACLINSMTRRNDLATKIGSVRNDGSYGDSFILACLFHWHSIDQVGGSLTDASLSIESFNELRPRERNDWLA